MMMVVATVLVFGFISFRQLPRNLMPDVSYPTVTVRTEYPGAAPIDVEDRVSERLESVLSQVKGLRRVSSVSRAELSEIILEFAWGTDMGQATMEVREKVDQAILPDEVERPIILRYDPTLDPVLQLGFYRERAPGVELAGDDQIRDLIDLRIEAEELIEKDLELVAGVAAVEVRGGYEKEIRIDVDEELLPSRGVTMELISRRLAEENQNLASGVLYEGDDALIVRSVNEFLRVDEIADVVIRRQGDVPVRLRDIARVYVGYKDPEVLTRYNGSPCVKIDVHKEADANVVDVARRVRDRVFGTAAERARLVEIQRRERLAQRREAGGEERKKKEAAEKKKPPDRRSPFSFGQPPPGRPNFIASRLSPGKQVVLMSDQSRFIENALDEVGVTVITGGALAIAVLYLFLRNFWFTTIVGLAIPLSVIATFAALKIFGVSLNIMSLGGLALGVGMLVDSSIVVLESIFRCREDGESPRIAAVRGGRAVAAAVTASTLTTVAVFFPIVFVEGVAGQVFRDQAITVVVSLVVSLAVSLTFIPTLVARRLAPLASAGESEAASGAADRSPLRRFRFTSPARLRVALSARGGRRLLWPVLLPLYTAQLVVEGFGYLMLAVATALGALARRCGVIWSSFFGRSTGAAFRAFDATWARIEIGYPALIRTALRHRGAVIAAAVVSALVAALIFPRLGTELIPEVHQGEFTVEVTLPIGSRIERTDDRIRPLERRIIEQSNVASVTTTVGVEKDSLDAGEQGEHTARILVRIAGTGAPRVLEEEVKAGVRRVFSGIPDTTIKLRNPTLFSFKTPIEVEVKGYSLTRLRQLASEVEEAMRRLPSIKDVKSSSRRGYPELQLTFDRELLMKYGLDVATIGNAIRRKVEGEVPTRFTEGDRKVDLRVRLGEEDRSSVEDLRSMLINRGAEGGRPIALYDVATVVQDFGPSEIRRIGQSRAAVVTANLAGLDLGRATEDITRVIQRIDVPPEFTVGFGGQQSELVASQRSLIWALVLAIFLVYVVMAAQFESLVQPFVILFSIPLASVGIAVALWLLDISLSVVSFVGMIVLAGIVVNNAIVLIDCINQLRRSGREKLDAIAEGGRLRLRPILMTTSTTVLGLLPLTGALNWVPGAASVLGVGEGLEIRAPMAITVIVGLLSSTVLTLFVIPVIYSLTDRRA